MKWRRITKWSAHRYSCECKQIALRLTTACACQSKPRKVQTCTRLLARKAHTTALTRISHSLTPNHEPRYDNMCHARWSMHCKRLMERIDRWNARYWMKAVHLLELMGRYLENVEGGVTWYTASLTVVNLGHMMIFSSLFCFVGFLNCWLGMVVHKAMIDAFLSLSLSLNGYTM